MNKLTNRFVRICLFLMLFTAISSLILNTTSAYSTNGVESSKNTGTATQAIPAHARNVTQSMFSMGPDGKSEVNVNAIYSHEPAPMGIADFGINQSGAYQYTTSSFEGIVSINSLSTSANDPNDPNPNDPLMGIQLNVNLQFTMNNKQYVYWIQDCAQLDTSSKKIRFLDNIWNSTQASVNMNPSGVSGNGQVTAYNGGQTYYYDWANSGNQINLQYPATITLSVTCGPSSGGPTVSFAYNYGHGLVTYDTVKLLTSYPITSFSGFIVNGNNYTPCGNFYDSELILGGPYGGIKTQLLESDVQLQLEYWNGYNYQMITNAYDFGSDTAEGISNTLSQAYYYQNTGQLFAWIQSGSGSLSDLYYQSQIGIIDVSYSVLSDTLDITNASIPNATPWQTPLTDGIAMITIAPGYYNLQLYHNGVLYNQLNCTVTAGQLQSPGITSITLLPAGASKALSIANDNFAVSFTVGGQLQVAYAQDGTLTLFADIGSNVVISGTSSNSSSTEQWVLNGWNDSGTVTAGSTATYYYYDLLSQQIAYWGPSSSVINPYVTYITAPTFFWGHQRHHHQVL